MNEHVTQIIKDAIDVIETKGWTKGTMINADEEVCTLGALAVSASIGVLTQPDVEWDFFHEKAYRLVERALQEVTGSGDFMNIPAINDAGGTTREDVLLGLKHALNESERGGA